MAVISAISSSDLPSQSAAVNIVNGSAGNMTPLPTPSTFKAAPAATSLGTLTKTAGHAIG